MDYADAICLWILYRRRLHRRQKSRKYWVHPILQNRLTSSLYITLYPSLRNYEPTFFNYFRMSIQSFDDLLELIKGEFNADESAIRYCISPEEKLIITLSEIPGTTLETGRGRVPVLLCYEAQGSLVTQNFDGMVRNGHLTTIMQVFKGFTLQSTRATSIAIVISDSSEYRQDFPTLFSVEQA
ncbi:hypothetical protein QTP88_010144 [Uroleucon formosanum]